MFSDAALVRGQGGAQDLDRPVFPMRYVVRMSEPPPRRRVLITGASRGIGAAFARGFAEAGYRVALAARSEDTLASLTEELRAAGHDAEYFVADVGTGEGANALGEAALAAGPVDVLVNNAGLSEACAFEDSTDEDWERVFAVNILGVVRLTRVIGRAMLERGAGSIVMLSSVLGQTAIARTSPYIVSKGAIEQLTRALGVEWARRGVRVNAIAPGFIDTDMTRGEGSEGLRAYVERRTPMRRTGRPEEVVPAALYLASESSSFVTGSVVYVDGGWSAA